MQTGLQDPPQPLTWEGSEGPLAKFIVFLPPTLPHFVVPLSPPHWPLCWY